MIVNKLKQKSRWIVFSALSGILAGLAAAIFLSLLNLATQSRIENPKVIYLLPLAGFFIGWLYLKVGKNVAAGNNLILEEIHNPQKIVPLRMAPLILFGTILTHLFGGSAGREGTAVQMGASLSDQLSKIFKVENVERKILLVCGAGAGFGAAIGAPWAGMIFGMEVIRIGRLKPFAIVECFIASFVAYYTVIFLKVEHTLYPTFEIPPFDLTTAYYVVLAGILFGITARIFSLLTHFIEKTHKKFISYSPLKPAIAGCFLVLFYYLEGSGRYAGLGIPIIQDALLVPANFKDPLFKLILTALTVASGFKGGEFIPLVFMGTTLGSALGSVFPVSFKLLGSLGFAAVFAGAANTPIACTLMAMELFGYQLAPYAFLACYVSYFFSGHRGIYTSQPIHGRKHPFSKKSS